MTENNQEITILALHGGGTRGVLQAAFLNRLESSIGKSTFELFDMFSGVSIGGIFALLLATNETSASDLKNLFFDGSVKKIFTKNGFSFFPGIFSPKYKAQGKSKVLQKIFKGKKISSCAKSALVPAYDIRHATPVFFSTFSKNVVTTETMLADVADATSAAPTFFPTHFIHEQNGYFIDGGVVSNNPSTIAIIEALNAGYSRKNIKILSIATGEITGDSDKLSKESVGWGALQWLKSGGLIEKLFVAPTITTNFVAETMLGKNYLEVQFDIDSNCIPLDSVGKGILESMVECAEGRFSEIGKEVVEFITRPLYIT